jgi:hypothetical protein
MLAAASGAAPYLHNDNLKQNLPNEDGYTHRFILLLKARDVEPWQE